MKLDERHAKLDNGKGTKIFMVVQSAQTIFDRSQISGDGDNTESKNTVAEITYNLAYDNKLSDSSTLSSKIPAKLLGVDDDDRFFPVTEVISILNKKSMVLYYDKKYNDFIFVPFLDKVVAPEVTIVTYCVRGLGSNIESGDTRHTRNLPTLKNNTGENEDTDTYIVDSKTHVFFDSYSTEPAQYKNGGVLLDEKYYTETATTNVEEYFSLGGSDVLFEEEPVVLCYLDLPLAKPVKQHTRMHIDDVLIRIPF